MFHPKKRLALVLVEPETGWPQPGNDMGWLITWSLIGNFRYALKQELLATLAT